MDNATIVHCITNNYDSSDPKEFNNLAEWCQQHNLLLNVS